MVMKKFDRWNGKLVLGTGAVTGHQHTIRDSKARLYELDNGKRLLKLPRAVILRHEHGNTPAEHRDIRLPAGEPVVSYKRRYTPDGWEQIED